MDPIRQAAILVAALDMDAADALLEQMPDDFAAAVRNQVMELEYVDAAEEQAVIGKFLGRNEAVVKDRLDLSSGEEQDGSPVSLQEYLTQGSGDRSEQAAEQTNAHSPKLDESLPRRPPFAFLREADETTLSHVLQREHPQIVALILSHVEARLAADVLSGFSEELQVDVARRMVDLDEVDSQTLHEIDEGLRSLCSGHDYANRERAGLQAIQNIVAITEKHGSSILKNVQLADATLAAKLAGGAASAHKSTQHDARAEPTMAHLNRATLPSVEFSTLDALSDGELGTVLQHADGRTLLLALAGATPALMKRVYAQLPRDDAQALRRQIEQQGTIRLRDVEEAQRRIGVVAAKLAAEGEISLPAKQRLAVAA